MFSTLNQESYELPASTSYLLHQEIETSITTLALNKPRYLQYMALCT